MKLWRFSASNTHLYPGARLRFIDNDAGRASFRIGDQVRIEFADQGVATGVVVRGGKVLPLVRLSAHRTAAGTSVEPRNWALEPAGAASAAMKVKRPET